MSVMRQIEWITRCRALGAAETAGLLTPAGEAADKALVPAGEGPGAPAK